MVRFDGDASALYPALHPLGPIYLSGVVHPAIFGQRPDLLPKPRADLGVILTPAMGNRPDLSQTAWGADNACFADPDSFRVERFLAWLVSLSVFIPTCLFAVAPDVVGDAAATWERSRPVLPLIRAAGFPAALVAQNGIEAMPVEWEAFDVLFLGGCTRWKLSHHARELTAEARRRGKARSHGASKLAPPSAHRGHVGLHQRGRNLPRPRPRPQPAAPHRMAG